MTAIQLLRFVHVLFAVSAVGANVTYSVWLTHAAREPEHLDHALRGIAVLDNRVANPSYIMLLVTGVALVLQSSIPWGTSWLVMAVGLYGLAAVLGIGWYTPLLRAQIAALRLSGPVSDDYRTMEQRTRRVGLTILIVALAVLYLMVTKPTLW